MRSCWLMGALLLVLPGLFAKPDPAQLAAMADAIKYLQQLDKYYAQVSRPSTRSDTSVRQAGGPAELSRVRHALKMLKLQELDRFYSQRARPRFGKRTEQVEQQDGYEQALDGSWDRR